MNVIVVDDEKLARDYLIKKLKELKPPIEAIGFMNPVDSLEHVKNNTVDIAFLDIEMFEMTGIELAKKFKDIQPKIHIIFVTGFANYAVDAFEMHADGYVLKPARIEALQSEIDHIFTHWHPEQSKDIKVHTFGNFEVFTNNTPLKFRRAKSKEIFAYLIDRKGATVTSGELISILWENKEPSSSLMRQYQTLVSEMMATFKEAGIADIIIKSRNSISVDIEKISCDYMDFLNGDIRAINSYMGEYMANYSWAEFTTALLSEKMK